MPRTLVHGDFKSKNVRVRADTYDEHLIAFDWELAGYGPPAVDLHTFVLNGPDCSIETMYSVYADAARMVWSDIDKRDFEFMAYVGALFRLVASIKWGSHNLGIEQAWGGYEINRMRLYERQLVQVVRLLNGN